MRGNGAAPGAVLTGAGSRAPIGQDGASTIADRRESFSADHSTHDHACETDCMTRHYLSLQGVADHLGVSRNSVAKYALPEPDALIEGGTGQTRGWLVETIDAWNSSRPGPGRWGPREVASRK